MIGNHCLVVDDADPVRTVARRILERFGLSVAEAVNGEVALDMCRHCMPDGILLDWNMPVLDGITFLERLRAMEGGERPRVLFCTTRSAITDISRAFDLGVDDFVIKPFDIAILHEKLRKLDLIKDFHETG